MSWIEVRVNGVADEHARLDLTHIAHPDEHWDKFGPGAVGIGWDLSFLGLTTHLATGSDIPVELTEWGSSPDAIESMAISGESWIAANIAGGEGENDAHRRAKSTISFYTGAGEDHSE